MAAVVWCLCLLLITWLYLSSRQKKKLAFPGPKGLPFVGSVLEMRNKPLHHLFGEWSAQYGDVCVFSVFGKQRLVVSGPEALREVFVGRGKDFAGRQKSFRTFVRTDGNQNIITQNNLALLRVLRQLSQTVLNIYGRGRGKVEAILDAAVDNLVDNFHKKEGLPFDAWDSLYEATSLTVTMILSGECPKDRTAMFNDVKELNSLINDVVVFSPGNLLLDFLPALRYLPRFPPYARLLKCLETQEAFCDKYLFPLLDGCKDGERESLGRTFLNSIGQPYGDGERLEAGCQPGRITMENVRHVCTDTIIAGTTTTSSSFYALLGILVCHPDIQEKVAGEIAAVLGTESGCRVTLDHKDKLHYTRAVILELLRYSTVGGVGIPRVTRNNTELCGMPVPAGTEVFTNLWGCHHDPKLWTEPWEFKPKRFLSEDGYLVAADHPNRKQMFPFGAGTRVCLGELLATNRLFLFTANIVKQFKLLPGEKDISCDARDYKFKGIIEPTSFKIRAISRTKNT